MGYADLKNDFVFRKVFGHHPDVLMGLLNDLLDRQGERAIEAIEYLPSEQAPAIPGFKLSILDLKCRERSGAVFVVEMQVVHARGFLNRVVYNAAKAYIQPLAVGGAYRDLAPVVGVSICDFALWTDAQQDVAKQPRVPLVSRWRFTERASGAEGIPQVQFVFLELAKLGDALPNTAVERWAAIFSHAHEVEPESLRDVPFTAAQRKALEIANEATFSPEEHDAYRRVRDEIQQAIEYAEESRDRGRREGSLTSLQTSLRTILAARGLALTEAQAQAIERCVDEAQLTAWMTRAVTAGSADEVFAAG